MSIVLVFGIIATVLAVPQAAFAAEVHIEIMPGATTLLDKAYSPNPAQANVGDVVVWTNKDSSIHTATSGTASGGPTGMFGGTAEAPAIIAPSRTQQFTFSEEGEFPYYCVLHPTMVGLVRVIPVDPGSIESSAPITFNGAEYTISATSKTTKITDASLERENSLVISFDKEGKVTLEIPRAILANVTAVMLNGEALNYEPVYESDTATTIELTVPEDNVSIVIVPEFPFVFILLAVTFATVISFLKLGQRRIV